MRYVCLWVGPCAVLALLLVGRPLGAAAQGDDRRLAPDTAVTTGTLANGLRYYIRRNTEPEHRAELRLVVDAGSILEDDDQRGLAHFTEHMAFNGTRRFPKHALIDYMERVGMRFGAHINASTNFDQTIYQLTIPTDSAEVVATAFDILEDWAGAVSFEPEEIDRERGVVIEEWRLGRGAVARLLDKQFPVLFAGSRYAARLPIGSDSVLRTFSPDALRRFYRDWYRPDLMAVVAVGDFDPATVEGLIRERFSRLSMPAAPRPRGHYPVPGHAHPLYAIATDPEETNTSVAVYFKHEARDQRTVGAYRRALIERMFGDMLNDRLFEIQQRPDAPFLFGSVGQGRFVRPLEVWLMVAGVPDGGTVRGLEAVLTEAERVRRFGFTAPELTLEKTRMLRGMEQAWAERANLPSASYAGQYVRHYLEGEPFPGIDREHALYQELIPAVTLEDVNRLAANLLGEENRVVVVSAPEGSKVPDAAALAQVFDRVTGTALTAYHRRETGTELLREPPAPGAVVEEKTLPSIGVTEWRLANGVRVLLKPTDFKDDEVLFRGLSPGGTSLVADSDYVAALTATNVVVGGGVGRFSLVELDRLLAGKAIRVYPEVFALGEGMSGGGSPDDLETMFQLLYLYFTAPRRDSSAFVSYQQRSRAFLRNREASPEVAFQDTLTAILSQHHFRARPFTVDLIDEMNLDRSLAFYRERFADAGDFIFAFAGAFTLEEIRPLVERYLGGLPARSRHEAWRDPGIRPPTGTIRSVVRKGIEPKSQTQIMFTGPFDNTPVHRHTLVSMAEVLQIWLRETLREDLGGTYGANVWASTRQIPDQRYTVGISFGSDPARAEEMAATVFREIERLKTEGPSADDLARIRETQRRTREVNLRQNAFWMSQLLQRARYGLPLDGMLEYDRLVDGLTAEAIRETARRYLRTDSYIQVTLLPERTH